MKVTVISDPKFWDTLYDVDMEAVKKTKELLSK